MVLFMTFLNFKLYLYHKSKNVKKCLNKKKWLRIWYEQWKIKVWKISRDDINNVKENKSMFGCMI